MGVKSTPPQPVPDLALTRLAASVDTVIDAELLIFYNKHTAGGQHSVTGESIYNLLMQNLEEQWVNAYIGSQATAIPQLSAAIVKRLQALTQNGSKVQETLEDKLKKLPTAPDVSPLFVGQRVWARWLEGTGPKAKLLSGSPWYAARVWGEEPKGKGLDETRRTFELYYDTDQKVHDAMPQQQRKRDVISVTQPNAQ